MNPNTMKITPRISVEGLRLVKRTPGLLQPDDDTEIKEQVAGLAAVFLSGQASGEIPEDADFAEWYADADMNGLMEDEGADPTA